MLSQTLSVPFTAETFDSLIAQLVKLCHNETLLRFMLSKLVKLKVISKLEVLKLSSGKFIVVVGAVRSSSTTEVLASNGKKLCFVIVTFTSPVALGVSSNIALPLASVVV